ncbi:MAG: class I SAM-dependent methyltransferase [Gemmatimonadota bacterium]
MSFYQDRIYPPLLHLVSRHFDTQRRELMAHARGRVLELGVGTGSNLGFYPPEVTDVVGIDPHDAVLDRAADTVAGLARNGLPYRIRLHRADAQRLPYDDASFDTVVAFLTMCTIPDHQAAAREAYRVLRPEGRLLVMEHVKADHGSTLARWQRRLNPLWTRAAVGCHLTRDTAAALRQAGFTGPLEHYYDDAFFPPTAPRIRGILQKDGRGPG